MRIKVMFFICFYQLLLVPLLNPCLEDKSHYRRIMSLYWREKNDLKTMNTVHCCHVSHMCFFHRSSSTSCWTAVIPFPLQPATTFSCGLMTFWRTTCKCISHNPTISLHKQRAAQAGLCSRVCRHSCLLPSSFYIVVQSYSMISSCSDWLKEHFALTLWWIGRHSLQLSRPLCSGTSSQFECRRQTHSLLVTLGLKLT